MPFGFEFKISDFLKPSILLNDRKKKDIVQHKVIDVPEVSVALKQYHIVLQDYLQFLSDYDCEVVDLTERDKCIIIEQDFVVLVRLGDRVPYYKSDQNCFISKFYIEFHELTCNNVFKFNFKKFRKSINDDFGFQIFYRTFRGVETVNNKKTHDVFNNPNFQKLNIEKRLSDWPGWKYNFIIYEFASDNLKGFFVTHTTVTTPLKYAVSYESKLEKNMYKRFFNFNAEEHDNDLYVHLLAFSYNKDFSDSYYKIWDEYQNSEEKDAPTSDFYPLVAKYKLKYYTVSKYIKNKKELYPTQGIVLKEAINGKYESIIKYGFETTDYPWKNELLMLNCVKKIFNKNQVIHQYHATFLGQMSYDVYVCKKKIAFEYQGEQHYKPIEYFGGKEAYESQKKRDELKKKISLDKGITLIYIRYDEDVSEDLILNKLVEHNINPN